MTNWELSGSISEKDKTFIETWENVSPGVNYIVRENRRGDEEYLAVSGFRKFKLSTYDRMLTEDKIQDERHNPFKNGSFRPVIVPEDITIESNPNAMSEEDIRRLFTASDIAWGEYMEVIDSPSTLQRMIDIANNGEVDLSVRRLRQLESMRERYTSHGKPVLAQTDPALDRIRGSESEPPAAAAKRGPGRPPKSASV